MRKARNKFPKGWDEARVRRLAEYYDNQTDEQAVAEYEASRQERRQTTVTVPTCLVPAIRRLLSREAARRPAGSRS